MALAFELSPGGSAWLFLVGDFESLLRAPGAAAGFDSSDADLECGPDDEADEWDWRRLLTGIREAGDSFGGALRVPECGGVGYIVGICCALKLGTLGACGGGLIASISLRLRLWPRVCCLGGESAVADAGCCSTS